VKKLFIGMLSLVALSTVAFAQDTKAALSNDAAYQVMKKMPGGVWHTKVNGTDVESHWTYGPDGASLLADTVVDPNGKVPVHLMARFGWDDATKQVYYLDAHGIDTVYFGHVIVDGKDVVMKFKGIVGDPGNNYIFRISFLNDDTFHATLSLADGDKEGKTVETFDWSRTKDSSRS